MRAGDVIRTLAEWIRAALQRARALGRMRGNREIIRTESCLREKTAAAETRRKGNNTETEEHREEQPEKGGEKTGTCPEREERPERGGIKTPRVKYDAERFKRVCQREMGRITAGAERYYDAIAVNCEFEWLYADGKKLLARIKVWLCGGPVIVTDFSRLRDGRVRKETRVLEGQEKMRERRARI